MESDDELDRRLTHALQIEGRAAFSTIAEVLGVSDRTIASRYAKLRSVGAVRVLGGVDPTEHGAVQWFLRIRCAPAASVPIAEALARRPDTSWVSLTSGGTEMTSRSAPRVTPTAKRCCWPSFPAPRAWREPPRTRCSTPSTAAQTA